MLALIGPSGSGKTQRILAEFRAALKARKTGIRLVVPTATLVQHLRNELAREGLVFSPKCIVTLSGFTAELCPDAAEADNIALSLATETAVREVAAPEFQRVGSMPGFHAAVVGTLSELDSAGCTPDDFSRIRLETPFARPLLAVWRNIQRQLAARGLSTRSQILRTAAGAKAAGPIWFDGFSGFTRPELELIEALSKAARITVALPNQITAASAIADLRDAGFTLEFLEGSGGPSEDNPVEAAWFQAENVEREADEIARRILLYKEFGQDFRDIAIVLRNAEDLAPLLETTLDRFGIPTRFYFSSPLADHPIPGFCAHLIEALLANWDLEKLLLALRLAPNLSPSPAMDTWDIAIRENIPAAGLDALVKTANQTPRLLREIEKLAELDAWRTTQWSLDRWVAVLTELPDRFRPARPRDALSHNEAAIERSQAAATAGWSSVIQRTADWLRQQYGNQFLSLEDFWRTAAAILRLSQLKIPDGRRNVVHVMSTFEARQWDPAVMFIPNLVEKVFPRYHSQDPFLPDAAIRELQAAGIRLRDSRARDEEETALFDALVQRPGGLGRKTRERCLSYPRRNSRGDENLKSSFFARVRAVESTPLLAQPALGIARISPRTPSPVRSPELLVRIAERHNKFSPSSLETFAKCPFQFYGTRTLRLEPLPDTPEDRLDFLTQGTIVHDVLKLWTPVRGDVQPFFDAVFQKVCQEKHIQLTYRTEILRQKMLANLEGVCRNFITFGEVRLVEESFDFALLPDIGLRGRIDRVDITDDDRAVIVDYKYSKDMKQNVNDESKLQGVLYTLAGRDHLGLNPQATIFLSVKSTAKPVGWGEAGGLELEPMTAEWLDKGLATVQRIVTEIRSGSIEPKPADPKHCQYCDVKDACRYESAEAVRDMRR